jgi:hypothetical protein
MDLTPPTNKDMCYSNVPIIICDKTEVQKVLDRAANREYQNAQINNPKEFKFGDILFTNVQVQSKKSSGTVQKLAYTKRGPYKIIKDYNSGSYELQPTVGRSRATIKKHRSDLHLSPQSLIPRRPTQSSDLNFGDLHKKTIS